MIFLHFSVLCRQMCGVHYRFDSQEGLVLGEIIGVRMLQQVNTSIQTKASPYISSRRVRSISPGSTSGYRIEFGGARRMPNLPAPTTTSVQEH